MPLAPTSENYASAALEVVDAYRVVGLVGRGGMASTYLCTLEGQGGFHKWVILKLMLEEYRDETDYVEMFYDEARLGARLEHPNIPRVFAVGSHRGLPYFVMDYVRGPTLHDLCRRAHRSGVVRLERLCWILAQVARAADYAWHGKDESGRPLRTVHRDISLSNVLVSCAGRPKLIDFGIARFEGRITKTDAGTLKGKVQYMAPEQIFQKKLDHRVDVFQIGVALYWACTGRRPFQAASVPELWTLRLSGAMPDPRDVAPDLPPELVEIIGRAMAHDPDDRYARAGELADALEGFASSRLGPPVTEGTLATWIDELYPDEGERPWRADEAPELDPSGSLAASPRRLPEPDHGWRRLAVAGLLVGLLGMGAVPLVLWLSADPEPVAAAPTPAAAAPGSQTIVVASPVLSVVSGGGALVSAPSAAPAAPEPAPPARAPSRDGAQVMERGGRRYMVGRDGRMLAVEEPVESESGGMLVTAVALVVALASGGAALVYGLWGRLPIGRRED